MSNMPQGALNLKIKRRDWLGGYKKRIGKTISVTGGKGGVGKSSIALKLAMELGEKGHKVLVVDCDFNLSNTQLKMGLPLTDNFVSYVQGKISFEDAIVQSAKFDLLSGGNGSLDLFDNKYDFDQIIIGLLQRVEDSYDFIILDSPAGLSRITMTLNAYSDFRIFVVTPDQSSITDSYSQIKILQNRYGVKENHLIVNKTDKTQFERIVNSLPFTVDKFLGGRLSILGMISQMDVSTDRFDRMFLDSANISEDKNINKIVLRLVDEVLDEPLKPHAHFQVQSNVNNTSILV